MVTGMPHPNLAWLRRHGSEAYYTDLTIAELKRLEEKGKLCPGDAKAIIDMLRMYGVRYVKLPRAFIDKAVDLAINGVIKDRQINDAALLLYAKARGLHLVSYNYQDFY